MQKLLSFLIVCCFMMVVHHTFAQNVLGKTVLDYSSKAPEVQQMQKFIDVPVSYFNGIPNISIPVHTVTSKSISVPLTLQYHAGGIKAEDNESYVGLGWSLRGIGSITRTIRGNEDEGIQYESRPSKYKETPSSPIYYRWTSPRDSMAAIFHVYGGWYVDGGSYDLSYSTLTTAFTTHNQDLRNGQFAPGLDLSHPYFSLGLSDPEPDLFYFDFGGYSGKFIFDASRNPVLIPHTQDLKITPLLNIWTDTRIFQTSEYTDTSTLVTQYFESFKISTPDGKDYYFGEVPAARVSTPYSTKMNMYNVWYLTRIIDRNAMDTVYFEYGGSGNGSVGSGPRPTKVMDNKQKFANPSGILYDGCVNNLHLPSNSIQQNFNSLPGNIKTAKEEIQFYGDSIKIIDRHSGRTYKKLQFDFDKFNSGRKKLVGFSIKDLSTNQFYPYSFNYYDPTDYKGRSAQDYWGYYNGASNYNKLMIGYSGCTDSAANRAPAWPAMKLDVLTEITYPTGGKSIFEYEPHSANTGRKLDNSIVSDDAYYVGQGLNFTLTANLIGGLRIKSIHSYDPIKNDTITKKFYYNVFGSTASSGHLAMPPSLAIDCSSFACTSGPAGSPIYLMSTHNLYPGSGTGSHVTYRNVTVQEEKNGVNNGRTEYEFYDDTNTDSAFYSNAISDTSNFALSHSYDVYPDWQFRRLPENFLAGSEKEKRIYNAAGQLLQKETSFYGSRIAYGEYFNVINAVQKRDICGIPPPPPSSSGGGGGADPQWLDLYKYGVKVDTTSGDFIRDMFEEPLGGTTRPSRPLLPPYQSYYFFYRTYVGEIFVFKSKTINESYAAPAGFLSDTTTYFYENNTHVNPTSVVSKNSKSGTITQQNLYAFDFNDVNNGDSTVYFMKKAFLNLPLAGFSYNNSNITSGAFRKYKLKSRTDSTIALPFEEYSLNNDPAGITAGTLNLGSTYPQTLNFPLSYFQKQATFYYNPDNTVSHLIKKGNDKVAVLWDYNKLFAVAQAVNADSADIAFTGFEASGNGNWTIGSSLRVTNAALTGRKSYSLSNGNITKAGLNAAKSYIVSYWSASSAATVNSTAATTGPAKNGWSYFEHKLPAGITTVTVSGSITIDELRLYPSDAQMSTYSFDQLLGVTSSNNANNVITYYEYDGSGRLRLTRDADRNILKIYDYFYTGFGTDTAAWRVAGGNTRIKPCSANPIYNSDTIQIEQVDINPNSTTYGTFRWAYHSKCNTCVLPDWQNTPTPARCIKNGSNQNTGEQEQEQRNMNPCSNTYNQTRWVSMGTNLTACPIPPPPCTGPDKMMINGVCVTGFRVYIGSSYVPAMGKWSCTYRYAFLPDCITGPNYTEYHDSPCTINNCIPE